MYLIGTENNWLLQITFHLFMCFIYDLIDFV